MSETWEEWKDAAVDVVRDALKGYIEGNRDVEEFVKEVSAEYAKEYWASLHAETDAEKAEHRQNLAHLQAQVKGEALRRFVSLHETATVTIGRVLETVGGVLLKLAPKIVAAL